DPLARGELAATMLGLDASLAAALLCIGAALLELRKNLPHSTSLFCRLWRAAEVSIHDANLSPSSARDLAAPSLKQCQEEQRRLELAAARGATCLVFGIGTPMLDLPVLIDMSGNPGSPAGKGARCRHESDQGRAGKSRHVVDRGKLPRELLLEISAHRMQSFTRLAAKYDAGDRLEFGIKLALYPCEDGIPRLRLAGVQSLRSARPVR